jgi:hypothetical protein
VLSGIVEHVRKFSSRRCLAKYSSLFTACSP